MAARLLALVVLWAVQDAKLPVPDAAAQKAAEKKIRETHAKDYAKKAAPDLARLAETLLEKGEIAPDPASKYVYLREASSVAGYVGDAATSLRAIDAMAARFDVDRLKLTGAALDRAEKGLQPADASSLTGFHLRLVEDALQAERFEIATTSTSTAVAQAKRARDAYLVGRAQASQKDAAETKAAFEKAKKARETIKTAPDDAEANAAIGWYVGLLRGDWAGALPHLQKGSDAGLRALAEQEAALPKDAAPRVALGDAWWERSAKEQGRARVSARDRAAHWYEKAYGALDEATQKRVLPRIVEWRRERGGGWHDVSDPKLWERDSWRLVPAKDGALMVTLAQFPPGEFDAIQVRFRLGAVRAQAGLGLLSEKGLWVADVVDNSISAKRRDASGPWRNDGEGADGGMVDVKPEYVLEIAVAKGEYVVTLDGTERLRRPTTLTGITEGGILVSRQPATVLEVRLRYKK